MNEVQSEIVVPRRNMYKKKRSLVVVQNFVGLSGMYDHFTDYTYLRKYGKSPIYIAALRVPLLLKL